MSAHSILSAILIRAIFILGTLIPKILIPSILRPAILISSTPIPATPIRATLIPGVLIPGMLIRSILIPGILIRRSIAVLTLALAAALLTPPPAAVAHHSFAMFDSNQTLSAVGTVKELQWGNPHTWLEIVVLNPDNTERPLSLELNGLSGLRRNGWKPGSLKAGDKVTVTYHPMRDGTPAGELVQVTTDDGHILKGQ